MKTAILGGGLTGVTLAHHLQRRNRDVVVLEAEAGIGGLCRSRTDRGYTFDIGGSHIIFSRDGEVLDFMRNALGKNIDSRKRNTKIFYKNRYVKYPFENGLDALPREDLFFCISEFVRTLIAVEKKEIREPQNFLEWIYYTFGKGIAECYLVPYNRKIWNFPLEKMSCHWVEGRIPRPPVDDIIKSAIGIETEGYTHQAVFSYPVAGGIEAVVRAIAEPVQDCILCNFRVNQVRKSENTWKIGDGTRIIEADRLISTIPLQHLIPCLQNVPMEVSRAVNALRYNSVCCVMIGIEGTVPDISWLYIPDPDIGLENRVSFPSNYSSRVAPHGCGSILAEITYNEGDEIAAMSDEEVVGQVIGSLEKMQLLKGDKVVYTSVARQKFAYVVYDLEYLKNIGIIREYCRREGISLVGRFSQFEYLNMDGCIRSAMELLDREP